MCGSEKRAHTSERGGISNTICVLGHIQVTVPKVHNVLHELTTDREIKNDIKAILTTKRNRNFSLSRSGLTMTDCNKQEEGYEILSSIYKVMTYKI